MSTKKHIKFAAPFRSQTFNTLDKLLIGRNGVVTGGDVSSGGGVATIQPLTFVQNGLLVELDSSISATIPAGLQAPYYIVVSVSSAVENLAEVITPTFATRPQDISTNSVLVAYYDGQEWIQTPRLQIDELIRSMARRTVKQDAIGIADGFNVSLNLGILDVAPGSLFDRNGELFTKNQLASFPLAPDDIDGWQRIDQVLFRRPDDAVVRAGTLRYTHGNSFDGGNPYTQIHELPLSATSAAKNVAKVLLDNTTNNTKYYFWVEDVGSRATLQFAKVLDSATPVVTAAVSLTTGGISGFDVVFEPGVSFGVVYSVGNSIYYRKFDLAGAPLTAAVLIQTSAVPIINPKVVTINSGTTYFLHIVWQEITSAVVYKLYYARLSSTATTETTPSLLVDLTDKVANPSLEKDDDDHVMYLAFENTSTGRIYMRQYLSDTATSAIPPTQLGATLEVADDTKNLDTLVVYPIGGASNPIIKRANNKDLFVFWLQHKGGGLYSVAAYGNRYLHDFGHKALLRDLVAPGENFDAFDVVVDYMNTAHLSVLDVSAASKATIKLEDFSVGVSATIVSGAISGNKIALDRLGALVHTWAFTSAGFTNNGAAVSPTQIYGTGIIGAQPTFSNEIVILDTEYTALPSPPASGDSVTITGSTSNDGTYSITGIRAFSDGGTDYQAIQTSSTLVPEAGSGSAQFQVPASSDTRTAKSTAGSYQNLRGFYVTPTDIHLAYRTESDILAVAGPSIEETPTLRRLYELFNSVMGGSGQVSWNVLGPQILSFGVDLQIRVFNRKSIYNITAIPGGLTINDGEVAYVILPDEDVPAPLTLELVPFGDGVLDRFGRRAIPIFWNIGGDLFIRFAPYRLSTDQHTVVIGESISQQFVDFVGSVNSTPNPNAHSYISTNYILQTDSHELAIGKLDTEVGALASQIAAFLAATALEETQVVGVGGTTIFNCAGFIWDADVSKPDIQVYVNGLKVQQDFAGTLTEDFRKNSTSQLEFAYVVPEGSKITVRRQSLTLAPAQEEEIIVGVGGTTTYNASTLIWDASNVLPDIQVFLNGVKAIQDQSGGLTQDYRKTSSTALQFAYTVPQGTRITVRLERNATGASIAVKDEGSTLLTSLTSIDFVGAGVTAVMTGPTSVQITIPGAGGGVDNLQKLVYNNTGVTIPGGSALAWLDDGSVDLADANIFTLSDFAGISINPILNGTYGAAIKGGNAANVLTGLGALPGQEVYLSPTPGGLTLSAPAGITDTVFKVGRAEPPTGFASPSAVDLYLEVEVVSTP